MEKPDGLQIVWRILDQAHEKMEHERMDEAYTNWEMARRRHGQSMDEWISYVKKAKLEMALRYLVLVNETCGDRWMTPEWFRFGASSLLNDVLMQLEKLRTGSYQRPTDFSRD